MTKTILLFGPTAVGKTDISIELAKQINGEIISADSMQVYRYMNIGTAKPSNEQRKEIPHHLIDVVDPDEEWTVSDFIERANFYIQAITNREKTPIIAGGTGLYLNAFINGYSFPVAGKDKEIRNKLELLSSEDLHARLSNIDPSAAEKINKKDKKRIIRALEVYEITGKPISTLQKQQVSDPDRWSLICLNTDDRDKLYERINSRVDTMIKDGLVEEVSDLLTKGYGKDLNSMQALGYKETIAHIEGKASLEDAIALIKQKTRNFAKRQLTWFKRFENTTWIDIEKQSMADIIKQIIQ